jgi:hypothetical protein
MKKFLTALALVLPFTAWAETVPFQRCFDIASRQHGMPRNLLINVARVESAFNADARSSADAHGLMQIRWPITARHLGIRRVSELYNPCLNVDAGARYLAELMARYQGDQYLALAAYNYGPGRIASRSDVPSGVQRYVNRVVSMMDVRPHRDTGSGIQTGTETGNTSVVALNRFQRRGLARSYLDSLQRMFPDMDFDIRKGSRGDYLVTARLSPADEGQLARVIPALKEKM